MFEDGYPGQPPYGQPPPEAEAPVSPTIPWQCKDSYPSAIAAMWETIKLVLLKPSRAFSNMRVRSAAGESLVFLLVLGSICGFAAQLLAKLFVVVIALAEGAGAQAILALANFEFDGTLR